MSSKWRWLPAEALIALCLTLAPAVAAEVPRPSEVVASHLGQPSLQGRGTFRWLGLQVYDALLWTGGARWAEGEPYALELRYARGISARQLVSTSVDELRRMGHRDPAKLGRWEQHMARLFPDVRSGDRLTGVSLPGRGARFYLGGRALGEIGDPEFARAFFSIWLGEQTRKPELRETLLGRNDASS